jgi:hypothetical protein
MPGQFIDSGAPSLQGAVSREPQDLPHGIISPPAEVRAMVAREEDRLGREHNLTVTAEARQRMTDDLTLQYYFDGLGYEVAYRSTSEGPEVLAVGASEIHALTNDMVPEQRSTLKTWLP